jgi:membrane protease YdiL (CAAX protease family)
MRRFVEFIRRRAIGWYLLLAFGFTWSLLPLAATSLPVSLIALCGPAVAALAVTAAADPTERRAFRARLTRWRIPIRWYLLALAIPWPVSLLRSGIEYACVGGRVELLPPSMLGAVVFVLVAGEEVGWRGFALPRLLPRFGPWGASVILGVVWGLWHLPLFFMPGMPQHGMPIPAFVLYTTALSVILTDLARRTQASVVIATLFHGAVNTFGWVNPAADPTLRGWTNALCYGVAALLLGMVAWGWHSSDRRGTT